MRHSPGFSRAVSQFVVAIGAALFVPAAVFADPTADFLCKRIDTGNQSASALAQMLAWSTIGSDDLDWDTVFDGELATYTATALASEGTALAEGDCSAWAQCETPSQTSTYVPEVNAVLTSVLTASTGNTEVANATSRGVADARGTFEIQPGSVSNGTMIATLTVLATGGGDAFVNANDPPVFYVQVGNSFVNGSFDGTDWVISGSLWNEEEGEYVGFEDESEGWGLNLVYLVAVPVEVGNRIPLAAVAAYEAVADSGGGAGTASDLRGLSVHAGFFVSE